MSEFVKLKSLLNSQCLMSDGPGAGTTSNYNTPGVTKTLSGIDPM